MQRELCLYIYAVPFCMQLYRVALSDSCELRYVYRFLLTQQSLAYLIKRLFLRPCSVVFGITPLNFLSGWRKKWLGILPYVYGYGISQHFFFNLKLLKSVSQRECHVSFRVICLLFLGIQGLYRVRRVGYFCTLCCAWNAGNLHKIRQTSFFCQFLFLMLIFTLRALLNTYGRIRYSYLYLNNMFNIFS